jgi:heat shock protein HslJ
MQGDRPADRIPPRWPLGPPSCRFGHRSTPVSTMSLPSPIRRLLPLAAGSLLLLACAKADGQWVELNPESPGTGPELTITGTVRHLRIEGGLFVLDAEDGTRYNPLNLPDAFRADGKQIEAVGRRRDDAVSIGMVGPIVELSRIRERNAGNPAAAASGDLTGTSWRLVDLAGRGVVRGVEATLEFAEPGFAAGNGSCNRFRGPVTVSGATIKFGALMSTKRACVDEAANAQETEYLAALGATERWEIRDAFLYIYAPGRPEPLRFSRR